MPFSGHGGKFARVRTATVCRSACVCEIELLAEGDVNSAACPQRAQLAIDSLGVDELELF